MNKHTIIGNLTRDPVAGNTQSGVNYCQFTVAVDRRYKPQNGPDAEFIRVTAWRALGDTCAKYLKKGRKVAVVGESVCRVWKGQEGEPRGQIELTAQDVEFLGGRHDGERDAPPEEPAGMAPQQEQRDPETGMTVADPEDIPF